MKNPIHALLVFTTLACAASLTAQSPPSAPSAPASQSAPAAQSAPTAPSAPAVPSAPATDSAPAAPTVDEIVSKHVEAIGGKEAIAKVKSLTMESSFTMMGSENPSTTVILDGVGYKNEMQFNSTSIVQCYTDKGGWTINPMTGAAGATPMPDDVYNAGKSQIYVSDPLYDYAAKGSTVELLGKEGSAYKVKLISKEKVDSIFVIDSATFLITSASTKGKIQDQEVNITSKLSDYRKTELGYTVPYAVDLDIGGQFAITIAVKKVELNKTIDPAVFVMPK